MGRTDVTFGVHLPVRTLPGGEPQPASAALLSRMVEAAKEAGFGSIWVTDHVVFSDPLMDCLLLLAAIAGKAGEVGLTIATGVMALPLRHPVALAQSLATLDILSGGNLIIGVGEGSTQSDFDALGLPFQERRKMLEDGVVGLRRLLTQRNVSHHGPYYSFQNVTIAPRPVQQPSPPIWLSSWGTPMGLRRVARLGDGWVASGSRSTPEEFNAALRALGDLLVQEGKDPLTFPNAVSTVYAYADEVGTRAREVAGPIIEKASFGRPFDPASGHYVVGDYVECAELLRRWMENGAKQICLWPVIQPVKQIRRFGEYVLPRL